MILPIISFLILMTYIIISCMIFKEVPNSLSNTYYMYKQKKEYLKFLFPIMMFTISSLLLPSWLNITEGSNWQFLSFLTCASIMFVGAAPNFKNVGIENKVHTIAAIISAICALSWCLIIVPNSWIIILINLIIILLLAFITNTIKKSYTFWLELIAFLSLYFSLFKYYIYTYICS